MSSSSPFPSFPPASSQQTSPSTSKPTTSTTTTPNQSKWKTPGQQRMYNRRLVDALRSPNPKSARAIKDAADSALALTARGQSLWSRAILTSRRPKVLLRAGGKVRRRKPKKPARRVVAQPETAADGDGDGDADEPTKERKINDRLRKLGRLVPGCRKLPATSLLEETADYVAALEMQVRTMRALAEALSAASLLGPAEPAEPAAEIEEEEEEQQQQHHLRN